jgi:hypothetical protein
MTLAFLPEIAAAAVALFAARAGDKLRIPFSSRARCEEAQQKAVVWSYDPSRSNTTSDAWQPVVRPGSC